jgi:hypothetical protein
MALECPDFEAEAKRNEKAKRKKPDDSIVSDSDDSGSDRPKTKEKKDHARFLCVVLLILFFLGALLFQIDVHPLFSVHPPAPHLVLPYRRDGAQNIGNKCTSVFYSALVGWSL